MNITDARLALYKSLDGIAENLSGKFIRDNEISKDLLEIIIELYSSVKVEKLMIDKHFEAAYHSPITGELEFLIARTLYHYSNSNKFEWKILLRRQHSKTAPDIRIEKDGKILAIIEVKAKAGWIQPFLSLERYNNDKLKLADGRSMFDPDGFILKQRNQLDKYQKVYGLNKNKIFYFLPTLAAAHRKKYKSELKDYYNYFHEVSGLPKKNLILLSSNLRLDLANKHDRDSLDPLDSFENMIHSIQGNRIIE